MLRFDQTLLGPLQSERALYLDFKGYRDAAPVVVGVGVGVGDDDGFEAVVTDTRFGDAALARDLRVQGLDDLLRTVVDRAADQSRHLVVYSQLDLDMIDRFSRAGDRVADLALVAQELATDEDTTRWGSLAEELAELGHPLPKRLGSRHTTPRLRYVEQQLQRHDAFEAITATAKAKWTKLLQQCRSDCLGLRQLTRLRAGPDGGR